MHAVGLGILPLSFQIKDIRIDTCTSEEEMPSVLILQSPNNTDPLYVLRACAHVRIRATLYACVVWIWM